MIERVAIIGATGNVGSELVRRIYGEDTDSRNKNPTSVVALFSSTSFIHNSNGLSQQTATSFASRDLMGQSHSGLQSIFDLLRTEKGGLRIVDVTASPDMLEFHKNVIGKTDHAIVTANKLPLVQSTFEEFRWLTKDHKRYEFSCSVMAGAPAIVEIRKLANLGVKKIKIEGCFSGTLGYITSELEDGKKFSEIVREARKKGFTEPNPAVDLSGNDVARKILILARAARINVGIEDVAITPLVPEGYLRETDPERLLRDLEELDSHFENTMLELKRDGKTIRYVAELHFTPEGNPVISASPKFLKLSHPLAQLKGVMNKIKIVGGEHTEDEPFLIQARGAGIGLTADNIRNGLNELIQELSHA